MAIAKREEPADYAVQREAYFAETMPKERDDWVGVEHFKRAGEELDMRHSTTTNSFTFALFNAQPLGIPTQPRSADAYRLENRRILTKYVRLQTTVPTELCPEDYLLQMGGLADAKERAADLSETLATRMGGGKVVIANFCQIVTILERSLSGED